MLNDSDDDVKLLHSLGYGQELKRRMSGFSNFAISLSIICILAGCITSFPQGFCSVGGAAIGLGWPMCWLISVCFALTMAQVASAFPTAGGLYHWASILGGRGWGWVTAWFNLAGLITVLAAINVGTYLFFLSSVLPLLGVEPPPAESTRAFAWQLNGVLLITFTQALFNHLGIRVTTLLTDFSGYWIMGISLALTVAMLIYAPSHDFSRLITFTNYSGEAGANVWPRGENITWLFFLSFLLPAYTLTGFDASAHTSEETVAAQHNVPRGIIRSVVVSGVFGWVMMCAVVLAIPDMDAAAAQGGNAFFYVLDQVLPSTLKTLLILGIALAQYFCGLATLTSASRMTYAFARDGGLPMSDKVKSVSATYRTPAVAIWVVAILTIAFEVYTPVYSTITAASVIFLYFSYVIPTGLGLFAYGKSWVKMGPWDLGPMYRVIAVLCLIGCAVVVAVSISPPNEKNVWVVLDTSAVLAVAWFAYEKRRFVGPPLGMMTAQREEEIRKAEAAVM